ncbi:hypothetical protein KC19_3G038000 [Ceratodon purpureus]|uniref:Uncharacterized protein n=1 Tax=Ceratodon purpureus TaxID=3225 RepID=A0A8T0IGL3_CERPU|nr:hypothetical protein KC19_3G038000 [Ceratodon purpureus]
MFTTSRGCHLNGTHLPKWSPNTAPSPQLPKRSHLLHRPSTKCPPKVPPLSTTNATKWSPPPSFHSNSKAMATPTCTSPYTGDVTSRETFRAHKRVTLGTQGVVTEKKKRSWQAHSGPGETSHRQQEWPHCTALPWLSSCLTAPLERSLEAWGLQPVMVMEVGTVWALYSTHRGDDSGVAEAASLMTPRHSCRWPRLQMEEPGLTLQE